MHRVTLMFTLLVAAAAATAEPLRLSEPVEAGDTFEVFGAPMDDKATGLSLRQLVEREDELAGQEVRVTTRIARVCQKKGCFFVASEGATTARVTFADYGFFVPTDSGGKQVTLVGTFNRQVLSAEQAAHYAEDLGEAPSADAAPAFEYGIVATSVLVPRG
jgi:hypothetical protein